MSEWVRGWRVWLMWHNGVVSPTGEIRQRVDVATVAQLRAVCADALANPWVATYQVMSTRTWDSTGDPTHCPTGHELVPAGVHTQACRCGGHRVFACRLDGWSVTLPTVDAGCGTPPGCESRPGGAGVQVKGIRRPR